MYNFKYTNLRAVYGVARNRVLSQLCPEFLDECRVLMPMHGGSITKLRVKGNSARLIKSKKKGGFLSTLAQDNLSIVLASSLGISKKSARVFLSRPISTILRIEEVIKGVMDSLLLCNHRILTKKVLIRLVSSIIKVGSSCVDLCIKWWKEFTSVVWQRSARPIVDEEPTMSHNNMFRFLLRNEHISPLFDCVDKAGATALAHLVSTRQMPAGGGKASRKSLDQFYRITSDPFGYDPGEIYRIDTAARYVARHIMSTRQITPKDLPFESTHISLSAAGDFDVPCSKGGRATKIISDVYDYLSEVVDSDNEFELPMDIRIVERAGCPRWTTWCREKPPEFYGPFGQRFKSGGPNAYWANDRRYGFDDAIGMQIFCVALLKAKEWGVYSVDNDLNKAFPPIPCKIITIPEPGGKCRIVTTTLWWTIVLQQPGGHFLREVLSLHEYAEAGLQRADQAWLYLNQLCKIKLDPDHWILSSDLTCATDTLCPQLVEPMVNGFLSCLGIRNSAMLNLALRLATCIKEVHDPESRRVFLKYRGIFMGEPMAKSILTLHNLCTEELAIREFLGNFSPEPQKPSWRAFAVGGDDHIAVGPRRYLEKISENHRRWAAILSKDKHGLYSRQSPIRYCEKILLFSGTDNNISPLDINRSTDFYERSVFVDSIKVRLMSPASKSIEIQDDRNIAIGKAKTLGRTLRWLNKDYFPSSWIATMRDWFVIRMKKYLPKVGSSLYYQILLPEPLGGLDLYIDETEFVKAINYSPRPTQEFCRDLILKRDGLFRKSLHIRRLTSNPIKRGMSFEHKFLDFVEENGFSQMDVFCLPNLEGKTLWTLREELKIPRGLSLRQTVDKLRENGYYHFDAVVSSSLRGLLFSEILSGKAANKKFNTMSWKKRYSIFWDSFPPDNIEIPLDIREQYPGLININAYLPILFYNIEEKYEDEQYDFYTKKTVTRTTTFKEELERGLANLRVPFSFPHFVDSTSRELLDSLSKYSSPADEECDKTEKDIMNEAQDQFDLEDSFEFEEAFIEDQELFD